MSDKSVYQEVTVLAESDPGGEHPAWPEIVSAEYRTDLKVILALVALILLPLLFYMTTSDIFLMHLLGIAGLVWGVFSLADCLLTRSIVLKKDRIIKRRLLLGEIVIPARYAIMKSDQRIIRFYHGSWDNFRERITIRRFMIRKEVEEKVLGHVKKVFRITKNLRHGNDSAATWAEVDYEATGAKSRYRTMTQFNKAVASYKRALIFIVIAAIVVFFFVAIPDSFDGFAPSLSAFLLIVIGGLLSTAAYFLLRMLNPKGLPAASDEKALAAKHFLIKRLDNAASLSALITTLVAVTALVIFMLKGNLVDFYLFTGIAIFYHLDFYPRLSSWEQAAGETRSAEGIIGEHRIVEPVVSRRRSLQVSLVLVGVLAVSSYGETQHYLYKSKKDCLDDWGSEQECKEPPTGNNYYRSRYYFGPRYGSYQTGRPTHSVGSVSVSRGGFGSLGGFHASFGG